jgi:hypothetical protein
MNRPSIRFIALYLLCLATLYNWHVARDKDPFLALWSVILLVSLPFFALMLHMLIGLSPYLRIDSSEVPLWAVVSGFFIFAVVPNAWAALSWRQEVYQLQSEQNGPRWLWHPRWLMSLLAFVITLAMYFALAAWQ